MKTISKKLVSLLTALAVALTLAAGAGVATASPAYAAIVTTYTIDGTAGHTWANLPNPLSNGYTLNITAGAGAPSADTVINIGQNANVTINGTGSMINNLRIAESATDTKPHTVTINNLMIAPAASSLHCGYLMYKGILNLVNGSQINGTSLTAGLESAGTSISITSSGSGYVNIPDGIYADNGGTTLNIMGSAGVNASSALRSAVTFLNGPSNTIRVDTGAVLTANCHASTGAYYGINCMSANCNINIICDGTLNASALGGISVPGTLDISGSGTVTATGSSNYAVSAGALSINGTTVSAFGVKVTGSTITLTNNAQFTITGNNGSLAPVSIGSSGGFTMSPGTTVSFTNKTGSPITLPFTASAAPAGSTWKISGNVSNPGSPTASTTSSQAVAFLSGTTAGKVQLVAPTYNVAFVMNNDNAGAQIFTNSEVTSGSLCPNPGNAALTGYTFGGWYKEASCANAWNFDTDIVTGDMVLYAKWTGAYTVTFVSNNETIAPIFTMMEDMAPGDLCPLPATTPVVTGYTFGGWYKEAACVNAWNFDTDTITGSMTLYAKWTAAVSAAAQAVIDAINALPNPVATAADAAQVAAAAAAYNALSPAEQAQIPQAVKDKLVAAQAQAAALSKAAQPAPVTAIRSAQTTFYVVKGKSLTIPYAYDLAAGAASTAQPVFTWSSDNNSNVSVTSTGKVKGLVAGKTAKITVMSDNGKTKVFTVKVVKTALKATGVSVSKPPKTMAVGAEKILKVKISPAKATGAVVKFSLDKASKKYVTVDKAGKVTAIAKGTAKITVKAGGQKTVITIKVK